MCVTILVKGSTEEPGTVIHIYNHSGKQKYDNWQVWNQPGLQSEIKGHIVSSEQSPNKGGA